MYYFRAKKRESKQIVLNRISTPEDKLRRHKNKERIWRRCVTRLALIANSEAPAVTPELRV